VTESFDVLSDVLETVPLRSWAAGEVAVLPPWGLCGDGRSAAFYCVLHGHCRLKIQGEETVVSLARGDLVLVMPGREHWLGDQHESPSLPLEEVLRVSLAQAPRPVVPSENGSATRLVCGCSPIDAHLVSPVLSSLPPSIVVKAIDGKVAPWLEETLRLMMRESGPNRPGRQAIVDHLAKVILIQSIREWIATLDSENGHWLAAILDPDIGPALKLMHASLEWPWTVASLADRVCLSRSTFAARFKAMVSKPPLQYLLECRMQKACALLAEGRCEIKEIASRIGYTTRTAFSNAFRRWSGLSPGRYRRLAHDSTAEGVVSRRAPAGDHPDTVRSLCVG